VHRHTLGRLDRECRRRDPLPHRGAVLVDEQLGRAIGVNKILRIILVLSVNPATVDAPTSTSQVWHELPLQAQR
jgi:hypothetical protein